MREFVLSPHYLEQGLPWDKAMRKGSKLLGHSAWTKAFAKVDEWYGPFDEPLTDDERNAWEVWETRIVRTRGEFVHGALVTDATVEQATDAIEFAERMSSWYAQRFLTSTRHPIGVSFRAALDHVATRAQETD